jgi:hypothetical protein
MFIPVLEQAEFCSICDKPSAGQIMMYIPMGENKFNERGIRAVLSPACREHKQFPL